MKELALSRSQVKLNRGRKFETPLEGYRRGHLRPANDPTFNFRALVFIHATARLFFELVRRIQVNSEVRMFIGPCHLDWNFGSGIFLFEKAIEGLQ